MNHHELDKDFIVLSKELKSYLAETKIKFDSFDKENNDRFQRILFVLNNKDSIFQRLASYFDSIWEIAKKLEDFSYRLHTTHYREELKDLLLEAEINKHIYQKPLGYAGDYITMNYIFDYNNNFLGETSYEILINFYTCNIPISRSNIKRKDFFKQQIIGLLDKKDSPTVLSLGCGSAREIIELLDEGKINRKIFFYCIDSEAKALDFIKREISKRHHNNFLNIKYINMDIRFLLRLDATKEMPNKMDFVYASGIFDYFGDKFAEKIIIKLFNLTNIDGTIIIVNASEENCSLRSYYEMVGDWVFNHRSKENILNWISNLNIKNFEFIEPFPPNNYIFLKMIKG